MSPIIKYRYILIIIFYFILPYTTVAQIEPALLQQFIAESKYVNDLKMNGFYSLANYKTAWIQKGNANNLKILLSVLKQAAGTGLREKDYRIDFIESFQNQKLPLPGIEDSLEAEVTITDAAIRFYHDLAYGNTKPAFGYDGLKYTPDCYNIQALLANCISTNTLQSLFLQLTGSLKEIAILQNKLRWFNSIITAGNYKEVIITSNKISNENKPLITKLYQLGLIKSVNLNLPDSILIKKVKETQIQFNLLTDGKLRSTLLQELNIPVSARIEQLSLSLNYYRWLNCLINNQSVIVVNIPAAYMKVYHNNKAILEMRMVVGKRSTPTPSLTSKVDEIILYPYWHVPYSIATKEILPVLKKNPGYINTGNYQVLNQAGKIVNPFSVNWKALSDSNFPYTIRQSTGCDNALGLLKLNFNNPFSVYLHDTNSKNFFKYKSRYFSHGCMRMEKPMELGHLILKNNRIAIDTIEQKGCLRNQSPITVPADEPMPVIVWYNPAGTDSTGRVLFYADIYKKFNWLKKG